MGISSFAGGIFGAMGNSRAAKARNRAAKQNYEHMLKVRKHEWYQQLSIWGAQRNKYYLDLNENDLAAQRGFSQAQVALNDEFAAAAQRNEGALIKYLQSHGKLQAAGRTGRSIDRIATLDLGALERSAGNNYWKLTRSREAYKANVENIRNQQLSYRNQLHANVAFAPIPDLAPPPPIYEKEGVGAMDILGAGISGLTSYAGAGGTFGRQGSGGSYLNRIMNNQNTPKIPYTVPTYNPTTGFLSNAGDTLSGNSIKYYRVQ